MVRKNQSRMVRTNYRKQGWIHENTWKWGNISVDFNAGSGVCSITMYNVFSGVRVGFSFLKLWQIPKADAERLVYASVITMTGSCAVLQGYRLTCDGGVSTTVPGWITAKAESGFFFVEAPVISI